MTAILLPLRTHHNNKLFNGILKKFSILLITSNLVFLANWMSYKLYFISKNNEIY